MSTYPKFCQLRDQRRAGEEAPQYTELQAYEIATAAIARRARSEQNLEMYRALCTIRDHSADESTRRFAIEAVAQAAIAMEFSVGVPLRIQLDAVVERDKDGYWSNPAIPNCDDEDPADFYAWLADQGLLIETSRLIDEDERHPAHVAYFELDTVSCAGWTPQQPAGTGWHTLAIFDSEDGPVWVWARRRPGLFPDRDPDTPLEKQGLVQKFHVARHDGKDRPGRAHHACRYFVLDMDHDKFAGPALAAYAAACADKQPVLAAQLAAEFGAPPAQPLTTLTEEQIQVVWQSMPGGADGWLKHFGFIQFALAVLDAANHEQRQQGGAA